MQNEVLLDIRNLKTYFFTYRGVVKAVDGVSLSFRKGEILGVVGESGSGKSVMALSILGLIPTPPGRIVDGEVLFEEKDLLKLTKEELRKIRGNKISMIFQEPMTSLNPALKIGDQVSESYILHAGLGKKEAMGKSIDILRAVNIPSPELRINDYPYQLSGGMRQRAMIAMALACRPKLLIADEPTTALDVTIQAQILDLMKMLSLELQTSIILITHNLGIVAEMANRVAVMYAGHIMEMAPVREIFKYPHHPYTQGLLGSLPRLETPPDQPLKEIPGVVPEMLNFSGCPFHTRCHAASDICRNERPQYKAVGPDHMSSCWLET